MPDKRTIEKAREDKREGKSPTTQAGEFVRDQIEKIRRGAHGARSPQQAIAIGLSEARRMPPTRNAAANRPLWPETIAIAVVGIASAATSSEGRRIRPIVAHR